VEVIDAVAATIIAAFTTTQTMMVDVNQFARPSTGTSSALFGAGDELQGGRTEGSTATLLTVAGKSNGSTRSDAASGHLRGGAERPFPIDLSVISYSSVGDLELW